MTNISLSARLLGCHRRSRRSGGLSGGWWPRRGCRELRSPCRRIECYRIARRSGNCFRSRAARDAQMLARAVLYVAEVGRWTLRSIQFNSQLQTEVELGCGRSQRGLSPCDALELNSWRHARNDGPGHSRPQARCRRMGQLYPSGMCFKASINLRSPLLSHPLQVAQQAVPKSSCLR